MRTLSCLVLAWMVPGMSAAAEGNADAAARAKTIAPFVDEQTVAVVHVDVSRVAEEPLVAKLTELLPDAKDDLAAAAKSHPGRLLTGLVRAGATEVYLVFTLAFFPQQPMFAVIPLPATADEKAVVASLAPHTAHLRVGNVLLVADHKETLNRVREFKPDPRPEMAAAFEAAGDTAVQVLLLPPVYYRRVIEETMPQFPKEIGGGSSTVLTRGALWAAAGIDLPPKISLRVVVQSQDAQAAAALNTKWTEVLRLLGQWKEVRGVVPDFDRAAALLRPKVEGRQLTFAVKDDRAFDTLWSACGPVASAATKGPREAASRTRSANNLKQIALAMHNYHDLYKSFPPPAIFSADGKPLLSWRVLILPFVEQNKLYEQFRLNEPWDSQHNRTLIEKMPAVYRCPGSKLKEKGRTDYVVPVGPQTVFSGRLGTPIKDITDGTSNTIMAVECDDPHAPLWTKPDDLPFDPKDPVQGLGKFSGGFQAVFCDGSVRFISVTIPPETLRALFTKAGGEPTGNF